MHTVSALSALWEIDRRMTFAFACFVVESACRISINFGKGVFTKDVELLNFPSNCVLAEETKICSPTCL